MIGTDSPPGPDGREIKPEPSPMTRLELPPGQSSPWRPSQFEIWRHFHWGLLLNAFKWSYLIQIASTLVFYFRTSVSSESLPQLLLPYYPMMVCVILALVSVSIPAISRQTRLAALVEEADDQTKCQLGRKPGLILGCLFGIVFVVVLPKFVALAASADGFLSLFLILLLSLFLLCILVLFLEWLFTPRRLGATARSTAQKENKPFPGGDFQDYKAFLAMQPLQAETPYVCDDIDGMIARQAARSGPWREAWPDDHRIIEIRDYLTRILRYACRLKSDSLLPDDEMNAFFALTNWDEFHDHMKLVMMIEEAFSVIIDDEYLSHLGGLTYLEFIKSLLFQIPPDYMERMDDELLNP